NVEVVAMPIDEHQCGTSVRSLHRGSQLVNGTYRLTVELKDNVTLLNPRVRRRTFRVKIAHDQTFRASCQTKLSSQFRCQRFNADAQFGTARSGVCVAFRATLSRTLAESGAQLLLMPIP